MAEKHIHKYHRIPSKYHTVWSCADSHCSHFMPPHLEHLVLGRASICWECGREMVLDEISMQSNNPTCIDCRFAAIDDSAFVPRETLAERSLREALEPINKVLDSARELTGK